MQLTVRSPEVPEAEVILTLSLDMQSQVCSTCGDRPPDWLDAPASATAMNPAAGPLGGPDICSECLNFLLEVGTLEVVNVDPRSF